MLRVTGPGPDRGICARSGCRSGPARGGTIDDLADGPLPDAPLAARPDADHRDPTGLSGHVPADLQRHDQRHRRGPGWSYDSALESVHRADADHACAPTRSRRRSRRPSADELRADTVTAGGDRSPRPATCDRRWSQVAAAGHRQATTAFDKADAAQLLHQSGERLHLLAERAERDQRRPAPRLPDQQAGLLRAVRLGDGDHAPRGRGAGPGGHRLHPGHQGRRTATT